MDMSSPSQLRLPHASAGPFWSPMPAEPRNEWHEIESLLSAPYATSEELAPRKRGIGSFAFVAAALMIVGGVLGWTLIGPRGDCGADCRVVSATAGPTGEAAPRPVATAGLAPRPDAPVTEGRSVAEPAPDASSTTPDITPVAPPLRHRRHHRHHHAVDF